MSAAARLRKELTDLIKGEAESGVVATPINDNILYVCVDDENIQLPNFIKAVPTIYLIKDQKHKINLCLETLEKSIFEIELKSSLFMLFGQAYCS